MAVSDPVALGMALSRASSNVDDALTGYLDDQRRHLHEQLKQLHLDIWEKFLGVFLRLATAVVAKWEGEPVSSGDPGKLKPQTA